MLGYAIYLSLGMNLAPDTCIDDDKVSAWSVVGKLSGGSMLKISLDAMLGDDDVRHVSALVNRSKHRAIVGAPASVSFSEGAHGLTFCAFEHRGKPYPRRWANDFAHSAFDSYQRHTLSVGEALMGEIRLLLPAPEVGGG